MLAIKHTKESIPPIRAAILVVSFDSSSSSVFLFFFTLYLVGPSRFVRVCGTCHLMSKGVIFLGKTEAAFVSSDDSDVSFLC